MKIMYCEQVPGKRFNESPVTLLTDSSVSRNRHPLFLPPHHECWELSIAPAFRISRLGKFVAPKFARRYYDAMTLVARLRPAGLVLPASATETAFDSSIVIGEMNLLQPDAPVFDIAIEGSVDLAAQIDLGDIDERVAWLSSYFMIKHGDIVVPGDVAVIHDIKPDCSVNITTGGVPCLDFRIK